GAAQAGDAPRVDDFHLACRKQHEPHVGCAVGTAPRRITVVDEAIADRPAAVLDEAAVGPAAADAKTARHGHRFAGGIDGTGHDGGAAAEDVARHLFGKKAGEAAVARRYCRTPAGGAVGAGELADDAEEIDEAEFRATERAGEPDREQALLRHLAHQRRRQAALAFALGARGADRRRERARRLHESLGVLRAGNAGAHRRVLAGTEILWRDQMDLKHTRPFRHRESRTSSAAVMIPRLRPRNSP